MRPHYGCAHVGELWHSCLSKLCPPASLRPAGAPRYNTTLFCDANAVDCWMVMNLNATQSAAAQACQTWGGRLIDYPSATKQRMVESYFRLKGTLPRNYWLAVTRPVATGTGTNMTYGNFSWTGTTDPLPSNISANPYTHWWGRHGSAAACAAAAPQRHTGVLPPLATCTRLRGPRPHTPPPPSSPAGPGTTPSP
jgi:hypothetical protein